MSNKYLLTTPGFLIVSITVLFIFTAETALASSKSSTCSSYQPKYSTLQIANDSDVVLRARRTHVKLADNRGCVYSEKYNIHIPVAKIFMNEPSDWYRRTRPWSRILVIIEKPSRLGFDLVAPLSLYETQAFFFTGRIDHRDKALGKKKRNLCPQIHFMQFKMDTDNFKYEDHDERNTSLFIKNRIMALSHKEPGFIFFRFYDNSTLYSCQFGSTAPNPLCGAIFKYLSYDVTIRFPDYLLCDFSVIKRYVKKKMSQWRRR